MSLESFRDAMVAIFNGDSAVQAVTERTTLNLVPRGAQVYEENLPVMTYFIVTSPQERGMKGRRSVLVQLEAWAREDRPNVFSALETLMDRAEALFVGTQFTAQGVNIQRIRIVSREDKPVEDNVRSIGADFHFKVQV